MIKLYRSNYDEFNPDKNGGDITDIVIESGVLHSFIPRIRPRMAEVGGERWFKFFVKTDKDIINLGIDVAKYTKSEDEEIYITLEDNHDEVESDIDKDNIRLFGGFLVKEVDKDNLQITADRDVSDFVKAGDWVTFYDNDVSRVTAMEVENVDNDKITFKNWSDKTILSGYTASSTILIDSLNKDEYIGIWIKQVVNPYAKAMENPADSFIINCWYDLR